MLDLVLIILCMTAVMVILLISFCIPYFEKKSSTDQQQTTLSEWVTIAVVAAEQIYAGPGRGEEKKAYVIEYLVSKGFTAGAASISEEIDALIELSVNALKNGEIS